MLPNLCGRDPAGLDAAEIARAVIESVAENTSDAMVAPLLWGAVAGPPGLAAYRAINTLDAMVGHRSPRYLRFGWAAARLDDAANWIPARVTAALAVACAPLVRPVPAAHVPRCAPCAATAAATPARTRAAARPPSPGRSASGLAAPTATKESRKPARDWGRAGPLSPATSAARSCWPGRSRCPRPPWRCSWRWRAAGLNRREGDQATIIA